MDKIDLQKEKKPPIWFMRQAGRYLPEYQKIRKKKKNFLDLCFSPDLASKISFQPIQRFNLDFIILFCDILVIPHSLGQKVEFIDGKGPVLDPISSIKDLDYKNMTLILKKLNPVFETLDCISKRKKDKKLIGFCGGPFTVLNYMIEGGTSKDHKKIKEFIKNNRLKAKEIIKVITDVSSEYLKKQIENGADLVQIFESWASLLDGEDFNEFIVEPNAKISREIREYSKDVKIIHFPRGSKKNLLTFVNEVVCDVLSLDENFPNEIMRIAKRKKMVLQGNLSPKILVEGGERLEREVKIILEKFKNNKHIFNLSHGILPTTPIENVEKTIEIVRNYETS